MVTSVPMKMADAMIATPGPIANVDGSAIAAISQRDSRYPCECINSRSVIKVRTIAAAVAITAPCNPNCGIKIALNERLKTNPTASAYPAKCPRSAHQK